MNINGNDVFTFVEGEVYFSITVVGFEGMLGDVKEYVVGTEEGVADGRAPIFTGGNTFVIPKIET